MCWSMGRGAKLQPAGQRHVGAAKATQLSANQIIGGANLLGKGGTGLGILTALQSISTVSLGKRRIVAPICSKMFSKIWTSEMSGTFSIRQGPFTRRVAGMMATAAFWRR